MSDTPGKHDLAMFFGSSELRGSKASSIKRDMNHLSMGLLRDSYIKSNQSLIMRIHQLEVRIRNDSKKIDQLREENALLKRKLYDRENLQNNEVIDALVEERIKRKLHKLGDISTRTIDYLQKAALNLKGAFEDFGLELSPVIETLSSEDVKETTMKANHYTVNSQGGRSLSDVCESPPLVSTSKQLQNCLNIEEDGEVCRGSETIKGEQSAGSESGRNKSFRSRDGGKENYDVLPQSSAGPSCKDGFVISTNTPYVLSPREISETLADPSAGLDTVRRKRTAALKIKNMAEPKLNNKLRRPLRHDEPHPFISSTY